MKPSSSAEVYLLDSSHYIFQAWFGYPDQYFDLEGRSVNAVYGYLRFLMVNLKKYKPSLMLAAFDESLFSGFRHQLYPAYKANRTLPPEDLAYQLNICQTLTEALGITSLVDSVYEADDLLAWGAQCGHSLGYQNRLVTRDKDLAQIIQPGDLWLDWSSDKVMDYTALCAQWGGSPQKVVDILALAGDSADNIPGVKGIGLKSALAIMSHFDSLDDLFANLDTVEALPIRGIQRISRLLAEGYEDAFLFRELVRLRPPESILDPLLLNFSPVPQSEFLQTVQSLGLGLQIEGLVRQVMKAP